MSAGGRGELRVVVFDLDGTLLDTMPMVEAAFRHAVEPYAAWPDVEDFRRQLGGPAEQCVRNLLRGDEGPFEAAWQRLVEFSVRNRGMARAFPGAAEVLDGLQAAGVAVGLWTSRDRASAEVLLRDFGLARRIVAAVYGDDPVPPKPAPGVLWHLQGLLGAEGGRCVYVGDADVDALAARNARMEGVLIDHGRPLRPEVAAAASVVVREPAQAYAWLLAEAGGAARGEVAGGTG